MEPTRNAIGGQEGGDQKSRVIHQQGRDCLGGRGEGIRGNWRLTPLQWVLDERKGNDRIQKLGVESWYHSCVVMILWIKPNKNSVRFSKRVTKAWEDKMTQA